MQVALFGMALLGLQTLGTQPRANATPREIYVESFENNEVVPDSIRFHSSVSNASDVVLIAYLSGGNIGHIRLIHNKVSTLIKLPDRLKRVQLREITIVRNPSAKGKYAILVPYGEDLQSCFLNGRDVYRRVEIDVLNGKVVAVQNSTFSNCERNYQDLTVKSERSRLVVE
jgi:hypothetical protein